MLLNYFQTTNCLKNLSASIIQDVSICSDSSEMTPSVITILSDEKGTAKDIKRGSSDANDEQAVRIVLSVHYILLL